MVEHLPFLVMNAVEVFAYALLFLIGCGIVWVVILYWVDKTQTASTLRRNYPVLARFRYVFEHLGEFFRQYFFALDREEMPFNRAERSWVYRAAKNIDSTVAFGSTRDLRKPGTVYFVNCPFPQLEGHRKEIAIDAIGPYSRQPYVARSRFNISGMSYGSISAPAIQALSRGALKAGIWLNTGEGGLSPWHLEGGCDIIFQIGTAKFGVRNSLGDFDEDKLVEIASHDQVKMFELKLSQGAKPGKGGILPAAKVTKEIAKTRGIEVGKSAISPNRHPEAENSAQLLDMLCHIRNVTGKPVGFKTVVGAVSFFEDLFLLINERDISDAPDFITIDGADGGTGAAPMSLMDNMGMPLREALPRVIQVLEKHNLRDRIKICVSGKLINPSEVAWAFCAGADFVNSARGFMFALGCIQALQCNKNTCPTGITTHNPKLQFGLDPHNKAERVAWYAKNMRKEIGIIAHSCGVDDVSLLKPEHARIILANGTSKGMDELYSNH